MCKRELLIIGRAYHPGAWIDFVPGLRGFGGRVPPDLVPHPISVSDELFSMLGGPVFANVYQFDIYATTVVPKVALEGMARDFRAQATEMAQDESRERLAEMLKEHFREDPYGEDIEIGRLRRNAEDLAVWFEYAAVHCKYVRVRGY